MTRLRQHAGRLEVVDTPGMHWLSAALFIGVGGTFFLGPLGLFNDADHLRWWLRILISLMGITGAFAGVYILWRAPWSRLVIDQRGARPMVRLEQRGLAGVRSSEWPLDALAAVEIRTDRDTDGDPVYRIQLALRGTRAVALTPMWQHGRESVDRVARALAAAGQVEVVG